LDDLEWAESLCRGVYQVNAAKTKPNRAIRVAKVPKMMVSFRSSPSKARGFLLASADAMISGLLIASDMTGSSRSKFEKSEKMSWFECGEEGHSLTERAPHA
jgi:hypothetical protein